MTPRPAYCRHLYENGAKCHAPANATGYCPAHSDRNAKLGGRPRKVHLQQMDESNRGWVAACSCVTGKGE